MKNIHVTLRVELCVRDEWEDSCSLRTITQDAIESAKGQLSSCINGTGIVIDEAIKPKVIIVT